MSSYATVAAVRNSTANLASKQSDISKQTSTGSQAKTPSEDTAALAKTASFYEKKTHQMYQAMQDIWNGRYTFQQTVDYHGYTPQELGTAFAIFGVQAMDIVQQRNVYKDTAFRAMALNKDGYSTEIEHSLPKAFRQKKAEAEAGGRGALFRQVQRLGSTRIALSHHSSATVGGYNQASREKLPLPKMPGSKR